MHRSRRRLAVVFLLVLVLIGTSAMLAPRFFRLLSVREAERLLESIALPAPMVPSPDTGSGTHAIPLAVNLPVPFTPQAPHGNWAMLYQEACEEAAALMAIRYAFAEPLQSAEDADAGIRELVRIGAEELHQPVDQTAEQIAALINTADRRLRIRLTHRPTVESLQRELSRGNIIIVPAAGRELHNPFFRRPGPRYHMLVLRGYTRDGYFITNDPGTKRGEGYPYPFERLIGAIHDWHGGNVEEGESIVIVVEPWRELKMKR